jgi:VanZ family protein
LVRAARICWGLTITYWAGLFALTHVPAVALPPVPVTDKTAHFVAYALLTIALMTTRYVAGHFKPTASVTILAIVLAYGAIDEWTQIPVGRSCEMADWYADAAGAAIGVMLPVMAWRLAMKTRMTKPEIRMNDE